MLMDLETKAFLLWQLRSPLCTLHQRSDPGQRGCTGHTFPGVQGRSQGPGVRTPTGVGGARSLDVLSAT